MTEQIAGLAGDTSDEVYRLYRPEWTIVHFITANDNGDDCEGLLGRLQEHFSERFYGRVHADDVKFRCTGTGINAVAQLLLRLPTLKGEFKYAFLAQRHADAQGYGDFTIVARNSAADHELRQYSLRKLPS